MDEATTTLINKVNSLYKLTEYETEFIFTLAKTSEEHLRTVLCDIIIDKPQVFPSLLELKRIVRILENRYG